MMRSTRTTLSLAVALLATVIVVPTAGAAVPVDTSDFRDAVTVEGMMEHLEAFQTIADDHGDTRASGTPGYEASVQYVVERLTAAGYAVDIQEFEFTFWHETADPVFMQLAPETGTYTPMVLPNDGGDFATMEFSGNGDVSGDVQGVDLALADPSSSTSGCESSDFTGFTSGNVALIQRGACSFAQKALNAEAAGAVGVIIFNQGDAETADRQDAFFGTLGGSVVTIPVTGTSFAIGQDLAVDGAVARLFVAAETRDGSSWNVLADTPTGRSDRVVLVGAHLDSVLEGPGINDNGSGTALLLEMAEQLAELEIAPRNTVRFAFWGAEEFGLIGSEHYASTLSRQELNRIMLNLNFDMVGSPNYVRFVYDGDGSAFGTSGPSGSGHIEQVFLDHFAEQELPTEPTEFDGRSDYDAFIARGIPAGGLFSGAEGIKTAEQQAIYGGEVGTAYDPCYHADCDDITNLSEPALDELGDAAAHAVLTFAMTRSSVNGTAKASKTAAAHAHGLLSQ